jgi:23S rRNA m2A2503 methyltransferase
MKVGVFFLKKKDIKSYTLEEMEKEFETLKLQKFRAKQVYNWLQSGIEEFSEMTNISKDLRERMQEIYEVRKVQIYKKLVSEIDETVKYVFILSDGELIESVLMKYRHGYSICISTQVGCKMKCNFCATGQAGFFRDLTPSEMLGQIQTASKDIGTRISNLVMMGMGEPLDNYENVMRFLQLAGDEAGLHLGMRHVSLSTCGIVDKIYAMADQKLQLTLSVSLHAPNDEIRSRTMPVNNKWNIEALLKACRYYSDTTKRRISFEYALIHGINDSEACARELAHKLKGILAHVNLIPVNPIEETEYKKTSKEVQGKFVSVLEKYGIAATVRRTLGADIEASCGQLRRRYKGRS